VNHSIFQTSPSKLRGLDRWSVTRALTAALRADAILASFQMGRCNVGLIDVGGHEIAVREWGPEIDAQLPEPIHMAVSRWWAAWCVEETERRAEWSMLLACGG
jgi:hypothetical protein